MSEIADPERLLTSAEVARLLQVDATSVINWSKKGYLAYYKTPGGHRRIRAADVVEFAQKRGMPVPLVLESLSVFRAIVAEGEARHASQWKRTFDGFRSRVSAVYVTTTIAALVELGTFRPHLLILDAAQDGVAAAEQIKKKREYQDLRIALSGDKFSSDLQKRLMQQNIECLTRPLESAAIAKLVA